MAGSSHEAKPAVIEREAERSGGHFRSGASARAGFIPIALDCVPVSALQGIPVYIRVRPEQALADRAPADAFRLYCGQDVPFTEARLRRLVQNRLKFLYIKISDHERTIAENMERLKSFWITPGKRKRLREENAHSRSMIRGLTQMRPAVEDPKHYG